ncbi:peptidase M48 family protein [Massilia sp. Root418]|uniref:M48 family metallopeptidase n=1 Tax=Massilia sp. Root418 TaxID=1736532 RepID=UPI0006F25014|nr:M48 family metallopeptidase [Massilia sp. Root418]KQW87908.1 peptidase M48 family protein [Massilia sp. Root418]
MELVYKHECTLLRALLAASLLIWCGLALATLGAALIYLVLIFALTVFVQSALAAYLKGTGVQISYRQFPDLKARIDVCCHRLGLDCIPEAYVLRRRSVLTAMLLGRRYIVLQSSVLDALEDRPDAINFYIGHEIGHITRRHQRWLPLLLPAAVLPLLGAAYARACAYTCDRHGLHACDDLRSAQSGLAALAAGGRRWRQLNLGDYAAQARQASGFWMSFHELVSGQPWLVKRMAALRALATGAEAAPAARHRLAWLAALLVPRLGVAGAAGGLLALALLAGAAALAWPRLDEYSVRSQLLRAVRVGQDATAAVDRYYYANGRTPLTLREAGFALADPGLAVVDVRIDGESGVVRIYPADFSLRGKAIAFTPALAENKRVAWRCAGEDIPARLLPPGCQGKPPASTAFDHQ